MKKQYLKLKSSIDNNPISVTIFIPSSKPIGIVQISHGMKEHKERYYDFMEYLTNNGYITVIHDHRGHGASIKNEEDIGYFNDKNAEYLICDLLEITEYINSQFPKLPVILFGHSMGAMCAIKYLKKYDNFIDKIILCGLPSKNSLARIGLLVAELICMVKNDRYKSPFLEKMTFLNYNKKIHHPVSNYDWLCSNEQIIKEYINDPLCNIPFTINGFINLYQLNIDIYNKYNWTLQNPNIPMLFIAGSNDPVIKSPRSWYHSQKFYNKLGYNNIQHKLYKNLRHELINETNHQEIYQDILNFIKEKSNI